MSSIDRIILGTVQLGKPYGINNQEGVPPKEMALELLKFAKQSGIKKFDSAMNYGTSYELLKESFADDQDIKVHTKFFVENDIAKDAETACKLLMPLKVETLYFHDFRQYQSWAGQGRPGQLDKSEFFQSLGVSVYTVPELEQVIADSHINVVQLPFNLLDCSEQKRELMQKAHESGMKVYLRSLFLQGLFFMRPARIAGGLKELRSVVENLQKYCLENKITISQLALNFPLQFDYVDGILFGVERKGQLAQNLSDLDTELPSDVNEFLSKISITDENLLNPALWGH